MIQDWLRYVNKTQKSWLLIEKNFKHCCGMTTDLVVEFIEKSRNTSPNTSDSESPKSVNSNVKVRVTHVSRPSPVDKYKSKNISDANSSNSSSTSSLSTDESQHSTPTKIPQAATLALKQLLLVLIELTAQFQESIARVGVSCLKHIILSTGHIFNEDQWMIACSAIHRACSVTIAPLRQLSFAFNEKSNSFYGDCATVKVTARRDSTIEEIYRVHALAQQVFLMDSQRDQTVTRNNIPLHQDQSKNPLDDRSFSFLLYPINSYGQNIDNFVIRIPYRNIVIGLLANQMLLQLVAHLLLGQLKSIPSSIHSCIFNSLQNSFTKINFEFQFRPREILIRCLRQYLVSSQEFDQRPGLKFLIQKVSNIDYAANLYKQMVSSWIIYYLSLVDSYLNDTKRYGLSKDDLQYILDSCSATTTARNSIKKRENFIRYLFLLQESMSTICEEYMEYYVDDEHINVVEDVPSSDAISGDMNQVENADVESKNDEGDDEEEEKSDDDGKRFGKPANDTDDGEKMNDETEESRQVRVNPFDVKRQESNSSENQSVSPEIEQQRASSIQKDGNFRKTALHQLVVASMELIKSLGPDSEDKLSMLLTPSIRKAFHLIQVVQGNDDELKGKQF